MDDGWRVDSFAVEEGNWNPQPANTYSFRASSKRAYRGRGDLYLLIQPAPKSVLSQTAIDSLRASAVSSYYESGGSVTRGLRAALLAGNSWLYEQNMRMDLDHRVALGLHYAVLRENDVYLGQIGPALATWIHGAAVDYYPRDSIWLRSDTPTLYDLDREPPAGWRREVEPDLFHLTLSPGDTLVLASPWLHRLVAPQALQQALAFRGVESALETIGRMTQGHDLTAMVIEWGTPSDQGGERPSRPAMRPSTMGAARTERRPSTSKPVVFPTLSNTATVADEPEAPNVETVVLADQKLSDSERPQAAIPVEEAGESHVASQPTALPEEARQIGGAPEVQLASAESKAPTGSRAARAAAAPGYDHSLPEVSAAPREARPPEVEANQPPESGTSREGRAGPDDSATSGQFLARDKLRENLSQGVERARQGTEELLTRVLPETSAEPTAEPDMGRRPLSMVGRALLGISLAIPLVMACMIILTRVQYERAQRKVFTQIQTLAQARYDEAATMQNVTYRRKAMREAMATAQEGLAIEPNDELLNSLIRQIEHKLDEIDGVVRLTRFTQLAELSNEVIPEVDSGSWGSAARIVVQDLDLFLLSRASGRVYRYMLNSAGDALEPVAGDGVMLRQGAIEEGVRIGEMLDITWLEAEGQRTRDGFAVLDRSGSLITYDLERGIDVTPVANSDTWLKPIALGCYSGNVYVLDPIMGAILKYIPTDNNYVNPPSSSINPQVHVDLTGAVDMAIDGSVYVLFADGRISKYFKGDPQRFDMGGLPGPMRNPTTLFISGEKKPEAEGFVYVVDSGNQRILEFDKTGNYLRQFKARAGLTQFESIQGIYVDAQRGRLFLLSGNRLWYTNLPARRTSS